MTKVVKSVICDCCKKEYDEEWHILEDVLYPVLSQMEVPEPEDKTEVQSTGSSQVVRDIYQQCAILLSLEKKIKSLLVHLEV